jgi:hypothetical protein
MAKRDDFNSFEQGKWFLLINRFAVTTVKTVEFCDNAPRYAVQLLIF